MSIKRVAVLYDPNDFGQIAVYQRCINAFIDRGVQLSFITDVSTNCDLKADLIVTQPVHLTAARKFGSVPIVIEERADSSMPMYRNGISCKDVVRVHKGSVVKTEWMNVKTKRPHCWLMEGLLDWDDQEELSEETRSKIKPGMNFGMYPRMEPRVLRAAGPPASQKVWHERPIDILFIGKCEYGVAAISRHRTSAYNAIMKMKGVNVVATCTRRCTGAEYFLLCRLAKIVVSPWGYGELCYRDFETFLDGAVLIKPATPFIATLGDHLNLGATYLGCAPDFSDLDSVVDQALSDSVITETVRITNRERILYWWNPEVITDWWIKSIDSALGSRLSM